MDERSDKALIAAANAGDRAAFEALYLRYRDWVYSLALRFCNDHHDACDVLQETFLYFLGKFPGFELRCQLKTFLYPAVRNLSIKRSQKRRKMDSVDALALDPEGGVDASTEMDPRQRLAHRVKGLPEAQREVVLLRFADDLDLQEIAEALHVPLGTVKSRLHHALKKLRNKS